VAGNTLQLGTSNENVRLLISYHGKRGVTTASLINSFYGKSANQASDQSPMPDFKSMALRIPVLTMREGKGMLEWR
jgi:hypothetical protein